MGPIFDTALAARAAGIRQFSLQNLIETYFQVKLSKRYQKANWKLRPLSKEQLDYAALDTVYLYRLYQILTEAVGKTGRLDQLEEECQLMEAITWSGKDFEPNDYLRIKGSRALSEKSQLILRELIVARDQLAKERDHPPFKVISSRHLILLSEKMPQDEAELLKLFPKINRAISNNIPLWLAAIQKGIEANEPLPGRVKSQNPPLTSGQEKLLKVLKTWRNTQAETEKLEPAMVLTGNVLKEVARLKPKQMEDFESIPSMRQWQIKRYGEVLIAIVGEGKSP